MLNIKCIYLQVTIYISIPYGKPHHQHAFRFDSGHALL